MPKTITCVLGDQKYQTLEINNKRLLVIHGEAVGTRFAIVPGWVTGHERYEKGQLAAVDVELIEPMDQLNLVEKVKSELAKTAPTAPVPRISFWGSGGISGAAVEEQPAAGESTVLVVDDDPTIRDVVKLSLEKEGCRVLTASNAAEASKVLHAGKLPDLMLLDIMMPGESGWQLLKELEKDPKISIMPVIAISGLEKPTPESKGYDSKMLYDYLVKPFSLAELSRVVKKFGRQKQITA